MKLEKYRMLLSAAEHATPGLQHLIYQRAYDSAKESYGKNSPEVYAVVCALSNHLENQGVGDASLCREQAKSIFSAS
jgi:hypothetical protein